MYFIDLTNRIFGRLAVISQVPSKRDGSPLKWVCKCSCGNTRVVVGSRLKSGETTGCIECFRADVGARFRKYSLELQSTMRSWKSMLGRCSCQDKRSRAYVSYVERNITVCKRWQKFENFLTDMGPRPAGTTVERKNNNRGYMPSNCTWAKPEQQAQNRRPRMDCQWLTYKGETRPMAEWSKIVGISRGTLNGRILRGWPDEKILSAPPRPWGR